MYEPGGPVLSIHESIKTDEFEEKEMKGRILGGGVLGQAWNFYDLTSGTLAKTRRLPDIKEIITIQYNNNFVWDRLKIKI